MVKRLCMGKRKGILYLVLLFSCHLTLQMEQTEQYVNHYVNSYLAFIQPRPQAQPLPLPARIHDISIYTILYTFPD